jgi:hypothetical protein
VYGYGNNQGVWGCLSSLCSTRYGYLGGGYGAYGQYDADTYGYMGGITYGAYAQYNSSIYGRIGTSDHAGYFNNAAVGTSMYGVEGRVTGVGNTNNFGVYGYTSGASTGSNYGVYGYASGASTNNFGGYFIGDGYFSGQLGVGTNLPDVSLDVNGDIEGDLVTTSAGTGPVCYTAGGANGGVYKLTKNTAACTTSSIRFKDNVTDFYAGLEELMKLRPVKYRYKPTNLMDIGFIAEEVENVSTDLVSYGMDGLVESVKYDKLTTVIVNAMKEQQAQIERIETDNAALKSLVCLDHPDADVCRS